MSQIIVKCPECDRPLVIKTGSGHQSIIDHKEEVQCVGCEKPLTVKLKMSVELSKG